MSGEKIVFAWIRSDACGTGLKMMLDRKSVQPLMDAIDAELAAERARYDEVLAAANQHATALAAAQATIAERDRTIAGLRGSSPARTEPNAIERETLRVLMSIGRPALSQEVGAALGMLFPRSVEARRPQLEQLCRFGLAKRDKKRKGTTYHVYYSPTETDRTAEGGRG